MKNALLLSGLLFLAACAHVPGGEADLQAGDRAAIIDLQHRYVLAMDYFDADGYAAVFTEDGVLDWAGGEVRGRDAIRQFMASGTYDLRKLNFKPAQTPDGREWPSTVRHLVTNQVIQIDGDRARAISYWMNYANNADRRRIDPQDHWARIVGANLLGTMHVTRASIAALKRRGGAIVNIASDAGLGFGPGDRPAYAAAKAGIMRFTSALRSLQSADGIRVNCIAPDAIESEEDFALTVVDLALRDDCAGRVVLYRGGSREVVEYGDPGYRRTEPY